jgi:D-glycero-D-manno-heptose 1,7-bisphosphate phosphatase
VTRRGAVIFDRDGVLNQDIGYCHTPERFAWIEGAPEAVRAVNQAGLFAFVATNQSGVGRGYYPERDVLALHDFMQAELKARGAWIDAIVYAPHHPEAVDAAYRAGAELRKPEPGMILDLLSRFPVDPARTVMIGDKDSDMQAAAAAGIEGVKFGGGSLLTVVEPVIARLR